MPGQHFFVGSYDRAGGRGLYPLTRIAAGEWRLGDPWPGARNVSFGVHAPNFGLHYLVDEMGGAITACRLGAESWAVAGTVASDGEQPCHLALDPAGQHLACANYGDGTVTLFGLDAHGLPIAEAIYPNEGRGPDPERQEGPHAHWVGFAPAGGRLYQTDFGTDTIRILPADGRHGAPRIAYRAPPGSGPRHLAFDPAGGTVCLVSELASTATVLAIEAGQLVARQTLSTVPPGVTDKNLGGHIGFNRAGDRLYVSNRGHDSVAVFAREADGRLTPLQHVASGGASPRFFVLLEEHGEMLLANEEGGGIAVLSVASDGTLAETGVTIAVPGPAFIGRVA